MEKEIYICEFCDLNTSNYPAFCAHKKSCEIVRDNWDEFLGRYIEGKSLKTLVSEYKISFNLGKRVLLKNSVDYRNPSEAGKIKLRTPHTEDSKRKISESRKEYFKENPDKHPWKSSDKFKSKPCENFKNILSEMDINFISEMSICEDRFFSVDIGIPQYRIAIEINGNQHYNRDGSLKDYYQKRHEYITNLGWKIHELHYSVCFDVDVMRKTIDNILDGCELFDFDYEKYLFKKLNREDKTICGCGSPKMRDSIKCKNCELILRREKSKEKTHSL